MFIFSCYKELSTKKLSSKANGVICVQRGRCKSENTGHPYSVFVFFLQHIIKVQSNITQSVWQCPSDTLKRNSLVCFHACQPTCLLVHLLLLACLPTHLSAYLPICLLASLLLACLPAYLPAYLPTCLSAYLTACQASSSPINFQASSYGEKINVSKQMRWQCRDWWQLYWLS